MQVEGLDHVHVEVADRDTAVAWYRRVLGLVPHPALHVWADSPKGPLILAGGDGRPTLALFARAPLPVSRDATIAFRVSGKTFLAFLEELPALHLTDRSGRAVSAADVIDHDIAWSIYFADPDKNAIELTTYDKVALNGS